MTVRIIMTVIMVISVLRTQDLSGYELLPGSPGLRPQGELLLCDQSVIQDLPDWLLFEGTNEDQLLASVAIGMLAWAAVKEFQVNYYLGETIRIPACTHSGKLS